MPIAIQLKEVKSPLIQLIGLRVAPRYRRSIGRGEEVFYNTRPIRVLNRKATYRIGGEEGESLGTYGNRAE
jgi:hypothetical protein